MAFLFTSQLMSAVKIEPSKKQHDIIIPKSVFRRYMSFVWKSLVPNATTGMRIQKKAFIKLHYAVQRQLLECLRAANKITTQAGRTVVTPNEIRLARQLLFRDITPNMSYTQCDVCVADNACRQLAKKSHISLSRKSVTVSDSRDGNMSITAYNEIRRLLYDLIVDLMTYIINHEDHISMIKIDQVGNALAFRSLRPMYPF